MDYTKNLQVYAYKSLHSDIHSERHTLHPCDLAPISLKLQWLVWKLNPRDKTITLTKLLIKHAKSTQKET